MSIGINVHLGDEEVIESCRVLWADVVGLTPIRTVAIDVDGATIYFRNSAQIRQMATVLLEAEHRMFALENPEMQEKAVQAVEA